MRVTPTAAKPASWSTACAVSPNSSPVIRAISGSGWPAAAESRRNVSTWPASLAGSDPMGIQPPPKRTARSRACGELPPTNSGGATGRGLNSNGCPLDSTSSLSKQLVIKERVSSVTAPRRFRGTPTARNSAAIQPAPTPHRLRPPESSCMVATHLAVGRAGRYGNTSTPVPRYMRSVSPASHASVARGSR